MRPLTQKSDVVFADHVIEKNDCDSFGYQKGLLLVEVIEQGISVNSEVYCQTFRKL